MVKRYDLITELYGKAIRDITETPENWMAFLRSASRNFRLPFDEQVLVYVQRPDAVEVMEMEDWRNKFGRWVKRDSKGIAVFDKQAPAMRLKYYYDVSDTREGRYKRLLRDVPLWEMEDTDRGAVQETLANTFGVEESGGFEETILEAAKNAAEDNIPDYVQSLLSDRQDSMLEELDELNVEVEAKRLLAASVSYMVMARCGIQAEAYLDVLDFQDIRDFDTLPLMNSLGAAISDVAEMALSPVSDTVLKLQKNKNRTLEGQGNGGYTENAKANPDTERSPEYGNNRIQQAGRLFSAEHHSTERTDTSPWEIRITSEKIPTGRTVRDVHNPSDAGEIEQASDGNAGGSTDTDGTDRERNGSEAERDGGTQSERPDDVGGNDEQHPSGGGGNRDAGTGLPLEWHDRRSEDSSISFFSSDSDIKSLLLTTPHLKATKEEIRSFYESHEDRKERTEYIKSIFNNEFTELTLEDGRRVGYKTYRNVLHLWEGKYLSRTAQGYYDWGVIAGYFEGMRLLGELWDRYKPIPTVGGQLSLLDERAEEKSSAFSFTQEIVDYVLMGGSSFQYGKYRIYSYFMQGHTAKEKADFLKNEYGTGGHSPVLVGTGIREDHDAKGLKLSRGYADDAPTLLLSWNKTAKRIDKLIAAGRYMTKRELEYLPEYEKGVLAAGIYHFYYNQPEEVVRPYPAGAGYDEGIAVIRPQLDEPERVRDILKSMEEVLDNTADFARNYQSMQKAYHDLTDFQNGTYSLFTPIAPAENTISLPTVPAEKNSRTEQEPILSGESDASEWESVDAEQKEKQPQETDSTIGKESVQYNLQVDKVVFIGLKEYRIELLTPEMTVLRDENYPLFTEEMSRAEFERKVRENPANDHLIIKWSQPELPAEKTNIKTKSELPQEEGQETAENKQEESVPKSGQEGRPGKTSGEIKNTEIPQDSLSAAERNYRTIMELAPEVLRGEKDSLTFEAGASFMPLTIEVIGKDQIAISHFFEQEGDSLADPDMEFEVNHETKSLHARMYQQDTLRRFENVIQDGEVNEELENELNEFAEQWFSDIREQGYKLVAEPRFKAEQTSDAFAEPFAVRDTQSGNYYDIDGIYQTFQTETEAAEYAGMLNRKETEPDVPKETSTEKTDISQEDIPIGTEFVMDGRKFQVDSINGETGNASLKDMDFLNGAGFPIFRNEPLSTVRKMVQEQNTEKEENKTEDFIPVWEQETPGKGQESFLLQPEIPQEKRSQYRITNDELGQGTPKEKFRANIAAIQMLKKCEDEGRLATPEEQKFLSGYVVVRQIKRSDIRHIKSGLIHGI